MRHWLREFRRYLIAAPLVLAVGFGWNVYHARHGIIRATRSAIDVPRGEPVRYGPATFELVGVRSAHPNRSTSVGQEVPRGAVVVVALFRGRIDDPNDARHLYCDAAVENDQGWRWDAEDGGPVEAYAPRPYWGPIGCDGSTTNDDGDEVRPAPHSWYRFAYVYYVPSSRAQGLRPTLQYDNPRYLRFGAEHDRTGYGARTTSDSRLLVRDSCVSPLCRARSRVSARSKVTASRQMVSGYMTACTTR